MKKNYFFIFCKKSKVFFIGFFVIPKRFHEAIKTLSEYIFVNWVANILVF